MDPLAPLRQLAAAQHGVVSRDQSRILTIDPRVIHRRMASGELSPLSAEVLRFTGASDTPMARAMAGVLDIGPGAVVSHTSALAMWQVPGFSLDPVHALRPRGYRVRRPTLAWACLWELAERRAARRARPGDARAPWRRGLPHPSGRSG